MSFAQSAKPERLQFQLGDLLMLSFFAGLHIAVLLNSVGVSRADTVTPVVLAFAGIALTAVPGLVMYKYCYYNHLSVTILHKAVLFVSVAVCTWTLLFISIFLIGCIALLVAAFPPFIAIILAGIVCVRTRPKHSA